ncbi:ABC transporter ATP-binding protein, partial [Pseudomonas sp. SIMBA_044]
ITHDIALMAQISNRIGIMRAGEIVEIGTAAQIVTNPSHDYTRSLWDAMPLLAKRPEGVADAV